MASLVWSVDVRDWSSHYDEFKLDFHKDFTQQEIALVQQASRTAGMLHSEEKIINALKEDKRDLFIALILAHLPNASILLAQVPAYDRFLGPILSQGSLDYHEEPLMQAFQNLKEVVLSREWPRPSGTRLRSPPNLNQSKVNLDYLAPIFSLPRLEKLSIFGFDIENVQHHCRPRVATSTVKNLTLINQKNSIVNAPDMQAILAMPKNLVSLSLYQIYYSLLCVSWYSPVPITNAQLFSALQQHQESLESLDVYREYVGCMSPVHHKDISCFGPLHEFKNLKELCIQPEVLLGENLWQTGGNLFLKDTLPVSLESLTLYGVDGQTLELGLEEQFREILSSADFPRLKSAVFEIVANLDVSSGS